MEGISFLQASTGPLIAISTSPGISKILEKNNFTDFTQFIRPFGERINNSELDGLTAGS